MAVQTQGAFACNFRAKSRQIAVEDQTVAATGTVYRSRKIPHTGPAQTLSEVAYCTSNRLG